MLEHLHLSGKLTLARAAPLFMAGVLSLALIAPARANVTFTNSFVGFGANTATMTLGVTNAEALLSSLFSNNVNVRIQFNASTAGLADANFNTTNFPDFIGHAGGAENFTYAQIRADLTAHSLLHPENTALASTVANLPVAVSCPGCNSQPPHFLLPNAESLALTGANVPDGAGYTFDGFINLNANSTNSLGGLCPAFSFCYDPTQGDGINANQFDLTAVMLHEITHVMGRVDYAFCGGTTGAGGCGGAAGSDPWLTPLDLDKFDCLLTTRNTVSNNACFSINGGLTDLRQFSNTSDTGDWDSAQLSANNAFISIGTLTPFLASDVTTMNAIGWDPVRATPEPASLALLGIGLAGLGFSRRKQ